MAKPKIDFKKILLERGEKIGIVSATAIMVLLFVWAGMAITTSASTDKLQKDLDTRVGEIQNAIKSSSGEPAPIEPALMGPVAFPTLASTKTEFFVAQQLDNTKRGSPQILGPTEFQVDLVRAPILVYMFTPDGDKIFTVQEKEKNPNLKPTTIGDRRRNSNPKKPANPQAAPGTGPGMPPGGPGGPPGMGGPGMGGPGMGGPGMGGPGMGGPGMGGPGTGANAAAAAKEYGLIPVPLKDFDPGKNRAAEQIKPLRMVIVHASFPLKKQMEEYQKALRYGSLSELLAHEPDLPTFKGYNVERQIRTLDGSKVVAPWAPFDWLEKYSPVDQERIVDDYKEDEKLVKHHIIPPIEAELLLPLPVLAGERKYPKLELGSVTNAVDQLEKAPGGSRFSLKGNDKLKKGGPFARAGSESSPAKDKDAKPEEAAKPVDVNEVVLCRFIDVNVLPGYSYEYRIQIKVANPNLGKDKEVGRPDYALAKELVGPFVEVKFKKEGRDLSWLAVPPETEVYAFSIDTKKYLPPDFLRMEVQSWMDRVNTEKTNVNAVDLVGDWVMEDIDVGRGQYIAGVKEVKLPVWDPKNQQYHFKDKAIGKANVTTGRASKGVVPIDFNADKTILVDFEGSNGKAPVYVKGKTVVDDPGQEALILTPDGKLQVHAAAADYYDTSRRTRYESWTDWLEKVKTSADAPKAGAANDGFNKPGGGKP